MKVRTIDGTDGVTIAVQYSTLELAANMKADVAMEAALKIAARDLADMFIAQHGEAILARMNRTELAGQITGRVAKWLGDAIERRERESWGDDDE